MLHLVGVGLSIGGKPILHDLNLHVLPGEIHAILGMNGTGKSTLASVIMGLSGFAPTSGNIVFQGEDITTLSISGRAKRGITLAWQEPARFEGLTVKEYLELGKRSSPGGGPPPVECLVMVGLPPDRYLQRTVDATLSGGERKRVELASVLSMGPRLSIVEEGGIYRSMFKLVQGAAGELRIDYEADIGKDATCELDARIYGKRNDVIRVKESLFLNGEKSRGLAKSRIVASDHCVSEVLGEAVGNAPGARGHVDCVEIVKGKDARVSAVPRLLVTDDRAKLTHEAAIGSVDKKQVETLMARGLTEEESVDVVVRGILR